MGSTFFTSNFTTLLEDALSKQSQAIIRADFLFPNPSLPTLLQNTNFTDSLQCVNSSQNGWVFGNSTIDEGCGSVEKIFASWPNFYTCSWYPSLSDALYESTMNSTEFDSLTKLGVSGNQQGLSANVSSSVANCLNDYCQSSSTCLALDHFYSCSLGSLLTTNGASQTLNRTSAFACLRDNVCATTTEVNPDIGGLGVIISLLVQYSISLLALLLHGAFYLKYRLSRTREPNSATGPEEVMSPAKKNYTRHLSSLTSALVEFQKSQCFFAATLQIASLIILPTFVIGLHGKDKILLRLTSANAFAPIMLTLAHIEFLGGRNSIYLLLLSSLTFALGSAAYWFSLPQYGGGLEFFNYIPPSAAIMSCGNIAPFAPCYVQNEFFLFNMWPGDTGIFYAGPEKTGLAVWILSFFILMYRIFYAFSHAGWFLRPRARVVYDDILDIVEELQRRLLEIKAPRLVRKVLDVNFISATIEVLREWLEATLQFLSEGRSWLHIQLFLGSGALLMQLISAIQVLILSAKIIATQMGFGQIVAVGIWIPVFLEYAYLEIVGASEGTEYRLKAPLIVTEAVSEIEGVEPKDISIESGLSQRRRFSTV